MSIPSELVAAQQWKVHKVNPDVAFLRTPDVTDPNEFPEELHRLAPLIEGWNPHSTHMYSPTFGCKVWTVGLDALRQVKGLEDFGREAGQESPESGEVEYMGR